LRDIEEAVAEIEDGGDEDKGDVGVISQDVKITSTNDMPAKNSKHKRGLRSKSKPSPRASITEVCRVKYIKERQTG
jgi:hypothetical protein